MNQKIIIAQIFFYCYFINFYVVSLGKRSTRKKKTKTKRKKKKKKKKKKINEEIEENKQK